MASLEELSEDISKMVGPAIETVFNILWNTPMVNNTGGVQNSEGVSAFQDLVFPLVTLLATAGLLVAAIRLLWYRRLDPMMDTVKALLVLVFTTFAGVFVIQGLVNFGNGLADYMLGQGIAGNFGDRLAEDLAGVPPVDLLAAPFRFLLNIILGIAVIVGATIQIVALFYTQGIVYICAAVLPLAASAAMIPGPGTTIFSKIMGWLLGSILYKPVITLIYALGFIFYYESSGDEDGIFQYFLGVALILIATGALPMLWSLLGTVATKLTGGAVTLGADRAEGANGNGGGGGGASGAGFSGAANAAQGSGAVSRAAMIDQGLPSATTIASANGASALGTSALGDAGGATAMNTSTGAEAGTGDGIGEDGTAGTQDGSALPEGAEDSGTSADPGTGTTGTAAPAGAVRTGTLGGPPASSLSTGGTGAPSGGGPSTATPTGAGVPGGATVSPVSTGGAGGLDGGGPSGTVPGGAVTPTGATGAEGSGVPGAVPVSYGQDGGPTGGAVTPTGAGVPGGATVSPVSTGGADTPGGNVPTGAVPAAPTGATGGSGGASGDPGPSTPSGVVIPTSGGAPAEGASDSGGPDPPPHAPTPDAPAHPPVATGAAGHDSSPPTGAVGDSPSLPTGAGDDPGDLPDGAL